jgi:hypothetical protein
MQGTFSGVIAGINFAANDWPTRNCPKGAVANMSLGGGKTATVNQAVCFFNFPRVYYFY